MTPSPPLLQNIRDQPRAMRQVLEHQFSEGLPALQQAAGLIRQRGSVAVSGIGASHFASLPFAHFLAEAGIAASLFDASELLHYPRILCIESPVFVLVSRSGDTVEIVRMLPFLRERGATVIGITNEPGSQLDREAHVAIRVGSPPDQMVAVQTYTATLVTLHLLAAAVTGCLDDTCRADLEAVIDAAGRALPIWEEASRGWFAFFQGLLPIYLLARGVSLASAMEGALLFHEVAKAPAIAMGAGLFRHGPAEVTDDRLRALVFAPPDSTHAINVALAQDLARLGGQVRLIGPGNSLDEPPGLACWHVELAPALLSPILEILPVQWAAYRLAEWRGITPGDFRVLGQVTRSETRLGRRDSAR